MKPIPSRAAAIVALLLTVAACVPKPVATPPAPEPARPAPAPPPTQAPATTNWMDMPATPGDWRYAAGIARFGEAAGEPRFSLRCDVSERVVVLSRAGQAAGAPRMTVRTESQTRTLAATVTASAAEASLTANDRLLDAMALSKGRFAIDVPGTPVLYLPSWAEVTRVIEDCR